MEFIGTVHTPFSDVNGVPSGPDDRVTEVGVVEVHGEFAEGLKDLEGFSHVILLTFLHRSLESKLTVRPPFEGRERGVYATRSPLRPNHIGLTVCDLIRVDGRNLVVRGVDLLDGTPLLDIKPYLHRDCKQGLRVGWLSTLKEP